MVNHEGEVKSCHVWGVMRVRSWKRLETPTCVSHEKVIWKVNRQQPYIGHLRPPWLSTTYKSWDDAPSSCLLHFFFEGMKFGRAEFLQILKIQIWWNERSKKNQTQLAHNTDVADVHFLNSNKNTVDGRNPAPVDMVNVPLFTGFYASRFFAGFLPSTVSLL